MSIKVSPIAFIGQRHAAAGQLPHEGRHSDAAEWA